MFVDSRDKVGRFRGLLAGEIRAGKYVRSLTLSFEHRPNDSLASLLADFSSIWNRFAGGKPFRSAVEYFFGGLHVVLKASGTADVQRHSWWLHFHLLVVCKAGSSGESAEAFLLSEWQKVARRKADRATHGSYAVEFRCLSTRFRKDSAREAATRGLKYILNGFLGPLREPKTGSDGHTSLPVRDWPADRFLEACACFSKRGFQRFRASRLWKQRACGTTTLRLFRRRRRNTRGIRRTYLKRADYVRVVDQLTRGKRYVAYADQVWATLVEVYVDACLNECHWLADRLEPLLDRHRPETPDARSGA